MQMWNPFADPSLPHVFKPATAATRRDLILPLFRASELILELYAISDKYYAAVKDE